MPEFEESNPKEDLGRTYVPGSDNPEKPRSRRRSGGFSTGAAPKSNASMGEVDPAIILDQEGGSTQSTPSSSEPAQQPVVEQRERTEGEAASTPSVEPEPSEETLAAIKRVEERIAKRIQERDVRRKERGKNRLEHRERAGPHKKVQRSDRMHASKESEQGFFQRIGSCFRKMFGKPENRLSAAQKSYKDAEGQSAHRGKYRNRHSQKNKQGQGNRHYKTNGRNKNLHRGDTESSSSASR